MKEGNPPNKGKLLVFPDYPRIIREFKVPPSRLGPRVLKEGVLIDFQQEKAKRRPIKPA